MKFSILYLINDEIYYLSDKNSEIIKYLLPKNTIKFGKINNLKSFQKYFVKMLDANKLVKLFSSGNIKIITNILYSDLDKMILTDICKDLNFNKVYFINERDILTNYKNKIYINMCKDYTLIHYKKNNIIITDVIIENDDYFKELNNLSIFENKDILIAAVNNENEKNIALKHFKYQDFIYFLFDRLYEMNN